MKPDTITIPKPDDWHLHLRSGSVISDILPHTIQRFSRALVMPNLKPPIRTVEEAESYRREILACLPDGSSFRPLMTLYLTAELNAGEIQRAAAHPEIFGVKLYPAGATTHSEAGLSNIRTAWPVFEAMQRHGLVLQVHGEDTSPDTDPFDRERVFLETELLPLRQEFPELRIVVEHATTAEAVDFVLSHPNTAATITAHHLLLNRGALFSGGLRPHHYCLPLLKREHHRLRLLEAATSGSPKFFLGTDSAPHPVSAKQSACGCAGIYTSHAAIELYAEAFESAQALDKLEGFASRHGAAFYGLPVNTESLCLVREATKIPESFSFGKERLIPFRAGGQTRWRLA